MENSMDPPPAIYWTRLVTCICQCSALDNSLGPLARESPRTYVRNFHYHIFPYSFQIIGARKLYNLAIIYLTPVLTLKVQHGAHIAFKHSL